MKLFLILLLSITSNLEAQVVHLNYRVPNSRKKVCENGVCRIVELQAEGTGVIVANDGSKKWILTVAHNVENLHEGSTIKILPSFVGRVEALDYKNDLALLSSNVDYPSIAKFGSDAIPGESLRLTGGFTEGKINVWNYKAIDHEFIQGNVVEGDSGGAVIRTSNNELCGLIVSTFTQEPKSRMIPASKCIPFLQECCPCWNRASNPLTLSSSRPLPQIPKDIPDKDKTFQIYQHNKELQQLREELNRLKSLVSTNTGTKGEKGNDGNQGLTGERGLQGIQGPPGKDGNDGSEFSFTGIIIAIRPDGTEYEVDRQTVSKERPVFFMKFKEETLLMNRESNARN